MAFLKSKFEIFFGKAPLRASIYTKAHVYAKILMLAFNIEKIYAAPLTSDTYQNLTMANVTGHPFNNYSGISVSSVILNTTVPIDTHSINTTVPINIHSINTTAPAYTHSINNTSSNLTLSIGGKKSCVNCEIDSINSNNSESPIQADPQADTLTLNSTKKDVHPKPHENPVNFPYEHWPRWKKEYVDKSRARVDIEVRQQDCRGSCTCDENGAIIPRDRGYRHGCYHQWQADRCSVVLGCWCTAVLVQAVVGENRAPIEEYQAALNRIPQTVRNDNQRMLTSPPPPRALERIPDILLGPNGRPRTFDPTPLEDYPEGLGYGFPGEYGGLGDSAGDPSLRRGRPGDDANNGSN
ncbi:hypothetical protein TWF192_011519 [Orbilia oligospora]|nr:hypothetical protein TWF192_011519 [Orbilia oligospora]